MAAITINAADVRSLPGAIIIRKKAAEAVTNIVGKSVYIDSSGNAALADADTGAAGPAHVRGLVTAVGAFGAVTSVVGDMLEIVTEGPVRLGAGILTPGATVWNSTTAGAIDETKPTTTGHFPATAGFNLDDSILYVHTQPQTPVANP